MMNRSEVYRARFITENVAHVHLHAAHKGRETRTKVTTKRQHVERVAASTMQAGFRGGKTRSNVRTIEDASTRVQGAIMGNLARKETVSERFRQESEASRRIIGTLLRHKVSRVMMNLVKLSQRKKIAATKIFTCFDVDNSGSLLTSELIEVMKLFAGDSDDVDVAAAEASLRSVDSDGSGELEIDEFLEWARKEFMDLSDEEFEGFQMKTVLQHLNSHTAV